MALPQSKGTPTRAAETISRPAPKRALRTTPAAHLSEVAPAAYTWEAFSADVCVAEYFREMHRLCETIHGVTMTPEAYWKQYKMYPDDMPRKLSKAVQRPINLRRILELCEPALRNYTTEGSKHINPYLRGFPGSSETLEDKYKGYLYYLLFAMQPIYTQIPPGDHVFRACTDEKNDKLCTLTKYILQGKGPIDYTQATPAGTPERPIFTRKDFTSTSQKLAGTRTFQSDGDILMEIIPDQSCYACNLEKVLDESHRAYRSSSKYASEKEVLFMPGLRMTVRSAELRTLSGHKKCYLVVHAAKA